MQNPAPPPFQWQSSIGKLGKRMKFMLDQNLYTDVHFEVGPEKKLISAHRFVLFANSPVFERMFTSAGFDQIPGSTPDQPVVVPDISAEIFLKMLEHMYTESAERDKLRISQEQAEQLLYAAAKYDLRGLSKIICDSLIKTLVLDNVIHLYMLTRKYSEELKLLAQRCLAMIDTNAHMLMHNKVFLKLDREALCAILVRDSLNANEHSVYTSAVRWAKSQCEKLKKTPTGKRIRSQLGPALYLIRFPLIEPRTFSNEIVPDGVLNDAEIVSIYASHHKVRDAVDDSDDGSEGSAEITLLDYFRSAANDEPPPCKKKRRDLYPLEFSTMERRRNFDHRNQFVEQQACECGREMWHASECSWGELDADCDLVEVGINCLACDHVFRISYLFGWKKISTRTGYYKNIELRGSDNVGRQFVDPLSLICGYETEWDEQRVAEFIFEQMTREPGFIPI